MKRMFAHKHGFYEKKIRANQNKSVLSASYAYDSPLSQASIIRICAAWPVVW
jgi:hypothetical protein